MSLHYQIRGTWKSHRKRTLDGFAPYLQQTDLRKKRLISSMFGKLTLNWTKKYIYSSFEGSAKVGCKATEKSRYAVIDESEDTLVIKIEDKLPDLFNVFDGVSYLVIQFKETRYHTYYSAYDSRWHYVEWFQKVQPQRVAAPE